MKKIIVFSLAFFGSLLLPLLASGYQFVPSHAVDHTYYGQELCGYDGFKCIRVKKRDNWYRLFPNPTEREMVRRFNRTNISLTSRGWIVVPTNLKAINYLDLSPFPLNIKAPGEKLVIVNLTLQAFGAYDSEGTLIHWGPISAGRGWCNDIHKPCKTAIGAFRIFNKKGADCVSATFPVAVEKPRAPMPWCMYFHSGFALHGSADLPGHHASHGCVRLFEDDAKWLNRDFTDIGTRVIVMQGSTEENPNQNPT